MKFLILVAAVALAGCAGGNIKNINGPSFTIKEKLEFSADSGQMPGVKRFYNALRPGPYKAAYEDSAGVFYIGDGESLILGARENDDGSTKEPLAEGGFWLAKDQKAVPPLELFWLAGENGRTNVLINGMVVNNALGQGRDLSVQGRNLSPVQVGVVGGLGAGIAGALLATQSIRMARFGPRRVPIRDVPSERDALLNAMNGR